MQGYSSLVAPLARLTRKEQCFVWLDACEQSLQTLNERLTTTLVLSLPNGYEDFVVFSEVSGIGLGHVLMQRGKVIAYAS